jgi:hypothetical protein
VQGQDESHWKCNVDAMIDGCFVIFPHIVEHVKHDFNRFVPYKPVVLLSMDVVLVTTNKAE